ncbi:unnamed protein product [Peniophora sp. CBMAI 1063]|nr:unnamed protein product [Peniophora sp. CBMAI 1063]
MRSSSLSTLVYLAVAVLASPTPADQVSLNARDVWTPPARRDAFVKRAPEPEVEHRDLDQRSPFTIEFSARAPAEGTVTFSKKASGDGLNARYPFFVKYDGNLEASDIEELEARKADLERCEAELAAREAEENTKRDAAEQAAKREAEEVAKREAAAIAEREERAIKKRQALDDIEAREAALEAAKRDFEELHMGGTEALDMHDFVDGSVHFAKREPQFNLASLLSSFGNGTSNGNTGSTTGAGGLGRFGGGAAGARLAAVSQLLRGFGFNFRRDEGLTMRDLEEESSPFTKRQFNLASLLSSFGNGTANGNTGSTTAAGGLGRFGGGAASARLAAVSQLLSSLGFNFRRDEEELIMRDLEEESSSFTKRQFNLASLLSSFGNGTANGNTGSTTGAGGLGRFGGGAAGARLAAVSQLLSNLGFNFRRDEEELIMRDLDDELSSFAKRDPQFNLASLLSSFGNGTTNGNTGSTTSNAGGLGRLNALTSGRLGQLGGGNLNSILSGLGFNLRRDAPEVVGPAPMPLPFSFKQDSSAPAKVTKRDPFGLDAFVQSRRSN